MTDGKGPAPGLGEGYEADAGDGRHGISGIRWGVEWSAGYERRPAGWAQRWSWQNRGGAVDEHRTAAFPPVGVIVDVLRRRIAKYEALYGFDETLGAAQAKDAPTPEKIGYGSWASMKDLLRGIEQGGLTA